jgi:hypothetical protein
MEASLLMANTSITLILKDYVNFEKFPFHISASILEVFIISENKVWLL